MCFTSPQHVRPITPESISDFLIIFGYKSGAMFCDAWIYVLYIPTRKRTD